MKDINAKLLQQLRDGEIAISYDADVDNAADLNLVLKHAFGEGHAFGVENGFYYKIEGATRGWACTHYGPSEKMRPVRLPDFFMEDIPKIKKYVAAEKYKDAVDVMFSIQWFEPGSDNATMANRLGVMHWFEPVFEDPEPQLPRINGYGGILNKVDGIIIYGCKEINIEDVIGFLKVVEQLEPKADVMFGAVVITPRHRREIRAVLEHHNYMDKQEHKKIPPKNRPTW